jgi:DNA polymerase III psi subunit
MNSVQNPLLQYFRDVLGIRQIFRLDKVETAPPVLLKKEVSSQLFKNLVWLVEASSLTTEESFLLKRMSEALQVKDFEIICASNSDVEEKKRELIEAGVSELIVVWQNVPKLVTEKIKHSSVLTIGGLSSISTNSEHKRHVWNEMKNMLAMRSLS